MKNKKILIIILIAVTFAVMFSGCSNALEKLEDQDIRADAEDIIAAIEAEDSSYIYQTYFSFIDEDEFMEDAEDVFKGYRGQKTEIKFISTHYQNFKSFGQDGKSSSTKIVVYIVTTTESIYNLTLTYSKEGSSYKMVGFNISQYLDFVVNAGFANYTAKNWILLILNIVSYGIMIYAFVLCIKSKIKRKWLWIILILLQVGITVVKFPNTFNVNFSFIRLLGFSQYLEYAHGGTITSIFFHIFAIIFLLIRKSLESSYKRENEIEYNRITAEREESARIEQNLKAENEESAVEEHPTEKQV